MDWYRLIHTIGMYLHLSAVKRAQYLQKHKVFLHMGDHCMVMFRKIPLYPKLISFGNNVWIASQVSFIPHDVIHCMLNNCGMDIKFQEYIGCIEIMDNVFIGANSTILPNVSVGPNTIIAAGTLVNKSIGSGVYAGVPVRYICSLDEFMEKRAQFPQIKIDRKGRGGLSKDTVDACWDRFRKQNASKEI